MDAQFVSHQSVVANAEQQPTDPAAAPGRLIKCRVAVKTADCAQHSYFGIYPSTCGAAIDALERFGISKISVEAIRQ